jgi:hypothetical protein
MQYSGLWLSKEMAESFIGYIHDGSAVQTALPSYPDDNVHILARINEGGKLYFRRDPNDASIGEFYLTNSVGTVSYARAAIQKIYEVVSEMFYCTHDQKYTSLKTKVQQIVEMNSWYR